MVRPVPDVPAAAGRPARRPPPPARGRPVVPPTSCSTGRWRWSTTTWRSAPRPRTGCGALATSGRLAMGPWYALPDEFLVSGETLVRNLQLGLRRAARLRRGHGRRLPARHVRPRRPDAPAPRPVRLRPRRRVAGRAVGRRPQRLLVDGARRLHGAGRVPARGLRQRGPRARRRQGAAAPASTGSWSTHGDLLARADPLDERHRPPDAPAVAGPGRRGGQRRCRTTTSCVIRSLAEHVAAAPDRGPPDVDRRAAVRGPGQPAHGRGLQPRST